MYFLIIDFQVATSHQKFHCVIFLVDKSENMCKAVRNNSPEKRVIWLTKHGMSFATARLAVSKYGTVVTFDDRLNEGKGAFVVESLLLGINVINRVVREILPGHIEALRLANFYLFLLFVHSNHGLAAQSDLLSVHGSDSHHNFDRFCI